MSVASDKPEVVLLGTVHRVQSIDERIAVWAQRSKDFKRGVEKLVEDFGIKFIGEEAAQDRLSSAGNVALDHFVRYVNLDIPLCAQNQIRLHPETNETTSFDENK